MLSLLSVVSGVSGEDETYWALPVPEQGAMPDDHHPLTRKLAPQDCAVCHADKYEQWQGSWHQRAFSPGLTGQLSAFSHAEQRACLDCHAPRAEQQNAWLSLGYRAEKQVHGVDCASCHMRGGIRHGPRTVTNTPHGTVRGNPLFRESRFCAACHQFDDSGAAPNGKPLENTYAEWTGSRYADNGQTCQSCHMPQGKHEFAGIHDRRMTRRGLVASARRTAQGITMEARNKGAGHALPTYATPRIILTIISGAEAPPREATYVIQRQLEWSEDGELTEVSDTRLGVDESVNLDLPLEPGQRGEVIVRVEPDADYGERIYPALLALFGDEFDQEGRRRIVQAMDEAQGSGYILYRFDCPPWQGQERSCVEVD